MSDKSILIVSTNWVGDAIMSLPAVQILRGEDPDVRITVLAKPGVAALWEMHSAVNSVVVWNKKSGNKKTIDALRKASFDSAYILPNSFRSAYVALRAGISKRIGARGHWRSWMLSDIIRLGEGHQQFETMNILGVQGDPPTPELNVPSATFDELTGKRVVTLLPGAARGPSKRWPTERFVELAKKLRDDPDVTVVLSGGPDDAASCDEMVKQIGEGVVNLAGKTSIPAWAALLKQSDCVVANDSGGMHLAAAVGTPVVAIFGVTDPLKTAPLGLHVILQKSDVQNRAVKRDSDEAIRALSAVLVCEVYDAVQELI
jgi:heptosyltransferase II